MRSYVSYCSCGTDRLQLSLLSSWIPPSPAVHSLSYTRTVCSSPLAPTPSGFDLIPLLSFASKLLMERIVHLLFGPFQTDVYLCYSNGTVHQNHPGAPFCVQVSFKGLMGYNFSGAIDTFLTPYSETQLFLGSFLFRWPFFLSFSYRHLLPHWSAPGVSLRNTSLLPHSLDDFIQSHASYKYRFRYMAVTPKSIPPAPAFPLECPRLQLIFRISTRMNSRPFNLNTVNPHYSQKLC